jgi:cytochrome P450
MAMAAEPLGAEAGDGGAGAPVVVLDPAFKADSQARFARLRELGPVHRTLGSSGVEFWMVVSYDVAREALTHPALLKDPTPSQQALEAAGYTDNQAGVGIGGHMLESDPPAHTRLRRIVTSAFTPRRTQELAPRVQQIADELIDAMAPLGRADLVDAYAGRLPLIVIAELLGIPEPLRAPFRAATTVALDYANPDQPQGMADLHRLLADLIAEKREHPGEDLLSALISTHDEDGDRLSDAELVGTALLLVVAGHETTVHLLGNAVIALLRDPDQARLLRENPGLLPGAVEEFLRYDPPVEVSTLRYAAEDLELGGQKIARGEVVAVALGSASRDAPLDSDPAALDIVRASARHIAFGHGIHHCLGAPLARLEAATALGTLLTRIPDLEADEPLDQIRWIPGGMMHGPVGLRIRFAPQEPTGNSGTRG